MLITNYQNITKDDLLVDKDTIILCDYPAIGVWNPFGSYKDSLNIYKFVDFAYLIPGPPLSKNSKHRYQVPQHFKIEEYIQDILPQEINRLKKHIESHPNKNYIIPPLGLGLQKGLVFYFAIRPFLPRELQHYKNVTLMWNNITPEEVMRPHWMMYDKYKGRVSDTSRPQLNVAMYMQKHFGNEVDLERLNNDDILIDLPNGIYSQES